MQPSSSSSSRSKSKGFFSQSNRTGEQQVKDRVIGVNPRSNAQPLHFRNDDGRQQPEMPSTHLHDDPPPAVTKEAAVQTSSPLSASSSRSRWASLRSPHLLSSMRNATSASAAQPQSPPATQPLEDQQTSRAWHPQHSPNDSLPLSSKGFPLGGPSRIPGRSSSADSWRSSSEAPVMKSDRSSIARTVPPPLNMATGTHNPVVQHPTSAFRPQHRDSSSSSSSSSVPSSALAKSSTAGNTNPPQTSGQGYLSWRGTGSSHSTGMVPAFALAVAPPSIPSNVQPPWVTPPPSALPSSLSDSQSVKSFETTSSTASTVRPKRRGKRSKRRSDGPVSESSVSSSSPTSSS
ncbi:hypothetical protein L208DRAFT_613987 [Tricholoma matsutake]|nr:hypothetical protein L208DRAFT_613987 [Tricholoma matsutake 945]